MSEWVTMPWFLLDALEHSPLLSRIPVEVFLALALLAQYLFLSYHSRNSCQKCTNENEAPNKILLATTHILWYKDLLNLHSTSLLKVSEWKSDDYRSNNGWKGKDYMHSSNSHVRIFDYFLLRSDALSAPGLVEREVDFALSAVVYFSARAESHKVN